MKRIRNRFQFLVLLTALLFAPVAPLAHARPAPDDQEKVDAPVKDDTTSTTNSAPKEKTNSHHGISITFGTDGLDVDATNLDEATKKKVARKLKKHLHGATNGEPDVSVGQRIKVPEGQSTGDTVSVLGGLEINGTVKGDAVSVLGGSEINGTVKGDAVNVMGSVKLGPKAVIEGDLTVVGGRVTADVNAKTMGDVVVVGGKLDAPPEAEIWKSHPQIVGGEVLPHFKLLDLRPLAPGVWWMWGVAGMFFLIHLVVVVLFPRPVQSCVTVLDDRPITAFFSGLLLLILTAPLLFMLVVSVVGILVIPFFIAGLMASLVFGKVAVYRFTGLQLGRQFHTAAMEAPLMSLVIGTVIFYLFYMIPILGILTFMFLTVLGLGTALLAIVGRMKTENKVVQAPGVAGSQARTGAVAGTTFAGGEPGAAIDPGASGPMAGGPPPVPIDDPTSYPRVGFWRRFFATLLDFFIIIFVSEGILHADVAFPVFMLGYHMVMWGWKGTTVGGIIMGIRIYRIDGRPIDYPVAIVRSLASVLSLFVMGIGFFWAGWSQEKRSWHDLIAGTMIVRTPKAISLI